MSSRSTELGSPFGLAIDLVLGGSDGLSTKHDTGNMASLEDMVMSSPLGDQRCTCLEMLLRVGYSPSGVR